MPNTVSRASVYFHRPIPHRQDHYPTRNLSRLDFYYWLVAYAVKKKETINERYQENNSLITLMPNSCLLHIHKYRLTLT